MWSIGNASQIPSCYSAEQGGYCRRKCSNVVMVPPVGLMPELCRNGVHPVLRRVVNHAISLWLA